MESNCPGEAHADNPPFVYIAEAFVQPIILLFGFITNVISFVVMRQVRMNEVFQICLVALSLLDAMSCLFGFVQLVVEVAFYDGNIPQGYICHPAIASNTLYYIYLMFMCSSGSVVITIAIIRNLFVLRPMKARAWFTVEKTQGICVLNFIFTLVLFAPVSLKIINQACEKEVGVPLCEFMNSTDPSLHDVGEIYLHYFLSSLYGPVLIVVYMICLICIRFTVAKSVRDLSRLTSENHSASRRGSLSTNIPAIREPLSVEARVRSKTAKRITKTLLVILIFDVICTLPYVIQGIGVLVSHKGIFHEETHAGKVYDVIVEIFLNLRPAYNFWLYVYQHPEFRNRLKYLLHRLFRPCYKSKVCCPCCTLEEVPFTPTAAKTHLNWSKSASTQSQSSGQPWFKWISAKFQSGQHLYAPTPGTVKGSDQGAYQMNVADSSSSSDYGKGITHSSYT